MLFFIILYNPNIRSTYWDGNPSIFEYCKNLKKNKFSNSTLIFSGEPGNSLYQMAPFLINKKGIKLYNGNQEYSYVMRKYPLSYEDIKNIAGKSSNPVYVISDNTHSINLNLCIEIEKIPNTELKIYRVKF